MATGTAKPSPADISSTMFSYAQAAKGHATAQSSPQPSGSPAPPSTSSQSRDDTATSTTSASVPSSTSNDLEISEVVKSSQSDSDGNIQAQEAAPLTAEESTTPSIAPLEAAPTSQTNDDTDANQPARRSEEERGTRSASRASRATDSPDVRKGRKGKKLRGSEKSANDDRDQDEEEEKEVMKPLVLSEAPLPSVNVWKMRAQQQAATTKVKTGSTAHSNGSVAAATSNRSVDENKATVRVPGPNAVVQGLYRGVQGEKPERKVSDLSRSGDQAPRRNGPRGSRAVEAGERSALSLPLVADTSSWPDPSSAATTDEARRRTIDRTDRVVEKDSTEEAGQHKRKKEKWETMPFVPTVNFQTPLPQRGGKARGGARGGRDAGSRAGHSAAVPSTAATSTSPTTDKGPVTASSTSGKETRSREAPAPGRANSLPPTASKRASVDAASNQELRKPSATTSTEHARDFTGEGLAESWLGHPRGGPNGASHRGLSANRSFAPQFASGRSDLARARGYDYAQAGNEPTAYPNRTGFFDRRGDPDINGFNSFKETSFPVSKEYGSVYRDRGDGRGERGRGGYRGRAPHSAANGMQQQATNYSPNGQYGMQSLTSRQNGPYSPPLQQNTFGNAFVPSASRNSGRGSGRAHSGSNGYARGGPNGLSGPKMPALNTNNMTYDYTMQSFPTYAFQTPVWNPVEIQVLVAQVEYYFSIENLCKDFFIRKQMDSKGFVHFDVIASFNRIFTLAPDTDAVRFACEQSEKLDYVIGEDNVERLRLREKWDQFVLSMEERVEQARNDGPNRWIWRSNHSKSPYPAPLMVNGYSATSPTMFPPTFPPQDQMYQPPYMNGAPYESSTNSGEVNGQRYGTETQLSATVPEFSPSSGASFSLDTFTTFTDERVEGLMMVVKYDKKDAAHAAVEEGTSAPVANGSPDTSDHTHTNGVVDGSISESTLRSPTETTPKQQTKALMNEDHAPYPKFREQALEQRLVAQPGDTPRAMRSLYEFWSDFLLSEFNAKMYEDFRKFALEDVSKEVPSTTGLNFLLHYYNNVLFNPSSKPWNPGHSVREIFSRHYQDAMMKAPSQGSSGDIHV